MNTKFFFPRNIIGKLFGLLSLVGCNFALGGIIYDSESYNFENIVVHTVMTQNTSGWDYILYSEMRQSARASGPWYLYPWNAYFTVEVEPDIIKTLIDIIEVTNANPGLHIAMGDHGWRYFGMAVWFGAETDSETLMYPY